MSGFTPGPWWLDLSYSTIYVEANSVSDKRMLQEVCAVGPTETGRAQQEANARLIAAAPELLHACQLIAENAPLISDWLAENDPGAYRQVVAAIAKATGETK